MHVSGERAAMSLNRRSLLKASGIGASTLAMPYFFHRSAAAAEPLRVGVLFSLTGGLSIIEKSLSDATMMAITEINASGGVMGRPIEAVLEDGASDPKTYNEKASKLVIGDKIVTVFGSYTSASRKAVLPVFEKHDAM
jgi:urea transport system substrate-binding protein